MNTQPGWNSNHNLSQNEQNPNSTSAQYPPTAVIDRPEKKSKGKIFLIASGIFILVLILLALIPNSAENKAESSNARQEDESRFSAKEVEYRSAIEKLEDLVGEAQALSDQTAEEQVQNTTVLDELSEAIKIARSQVEEGKTYESADPAGMTDEELSEGLSFLAQNNSAVEKSMRDIRKATKNVEDSINTKIAMDILEKEVASQKENAQEITYEDLFRNAESIKGNYYKFRGKVIQSIAESGGKSAFRVDITEEPGYTTSFWSDTVLLGVSGKPTQRILEGDIINFVAIANETISYTTVLGAEVEIPSVIADPADITIEGHE
ncbi:hypothetical protein [Actinomyces sp.]|uniref:hypothetical protein n=1 Tax=Actinomyces sp. TaxID=29317 RepID=UPI002908D6E9|nr:hypothetical protein [Actinomyces sp.]MDU7239554.1 hypothetical protein [Actinomyces sp.]